MDPLRTTLLDLDAQLGGNAELCVGGGYGLFLKQHLLEADLSIKTLLPRASLPAARTTEDIDLFLRADLVVDSDRMRLIRKALDTLGFTPVENAKYMKFEKHGPQGTVRIDLLAPPLGPLAQHAVVDSVRVRPKQSVGLHARRTDEALALEVEPIQVRIKGDCSTGRKHEATILIPQAFPYLLMKLLAFRDRFEDPDKNLGRHHALDLYRIVALLTEREDQLVRELVVRFHEDTALGRARAVAAEYFDSSTSMGMLRIREHSLFHAGIKLELFTTELQRLLAPP